METIINGDRSSSCPTLILIQDRYSSMPRGQQSIARYILENPSNAVHGTISDLAQLTSNKSESSVVRFYRNLGFKSYKDFKLTIAQEIASTSFYRSYEDIREGDSPHEIKRKIFNGALHTLDATAKIDNDENFSQAALLLKSARRIVLLGYAASAAICYYAQFRFLELGYNCFFSPDSHMNSAILVEPNQDDLFFCISMSGETPDVNSNLHSARDYGAKVLSLTRNAHSTLGRMSDVVITISSDETEEISDAMNARLAQMCCIDVLFTILSMSDNQTGFSRLRLTRSAFRKSRANKTKG